LRYHWIFNSCISRSIVELAAKVERNTICGEGLGENGDREKTGTEKTGTD
jgi:hypothetical protein